MKTFSVLRSKYDSAFEDVQKVVFEDAKNTKLYEPIHYILNPGGKRIRPMLIYLICDLYSNSFDHASYAAVSTELLHTFSLVHDDIMDESDHRRGKETLHTKWNVGLATLTGDALFLYAYFLLSNYSPSLYKMLSDEVTSSGLIMAKAQCDDIQLCHSEITNEEEYLSLIAGKTAIGISSSLASGAMVANITCSEEIDKLRALGNQFGIIYQLTDDYLDNYGDLVHSGKTVNIDIHNGKKNLFYIKSIENLLGSDRKYLEQLYSEDNGSVRVQYADRVKDLFYKSGATEYMLSLIAERKRMLNPLIDDLSVSDENKDWLHNTLVDLI